MPAFTKLYIDCIEGAPFFAERAPVLYLNLPWTTALTAENGRMSVIVEPETTGTDRITIFAQGKFMKFFARNFKHVAIVAAAAIAFPLAVAQVDPANGPHDNCAGAAAAPRSHMHENVKSDGMPPREEFPMIGHPPLDGGLNLPGYGPLPPYFHDVTLTEAQQDKIFATMHASAPAMREQGKLVKKSADAIRELADSDSYDEAKLKSLADANARASSELMLLHARNIHQLLALLTPEQRKQVDAMKAKFDARHALRAQIEAVKASFDAPGGSGK
jgi:Spy/CpxP family protein refolding chaperone